MNDYTPTTEEVRERWLTFDGGPVPDDHAEFDRWLAEVERATAEKAVDETVAAIDAACGGSHAGMVDNPYRKETP